MEEELDMKTMKVLRLLVLFLLAVVCLGSLNIKVKAAPLNMPDGTIFDPIYYADTYADLKAAFGYNERISGLTTSLTEEPKDVLAQVAKRL